MNNLKGQIQSAEELVMHRFGFDRQHLESIIALLFIGKGVSAVERVA